MTVNDDAGFVIKDASWDDEGWTRVPNEIVRDRALSLDAKGLILVLASHSTSYKIHLAHLRLQVGVGREKLRKLLRELEAAGYLESEATFQLIDGKNRRGPNKYTLTRSRVPKLAELPLFEAPQSEAPQVEALQNRAHGLTSENEVEQPGFEALGLEALGLEALGLEAPGPEAPGNPTSYKKNNVKKTKEESYKTKNTPSPAAQAAAFEEFWTAYPKKVSKGGARRKYELAVRRGADPLLILAAVKRYAEAKQGTDRQFIKDPTTWLNQECWDDEILPAPIPINVPTQLPSWRRTSSTFVTPNGRLMER